MSGRTNPYVGLAPFREADAEWFFGRSSEQRIIAANLRAARLTLLYGASGVGKSSVLRAGVVADLREVIARHRALAALPAAPPGVGLQERAPLAVTFFSSWGAAPLRPLAAAIHASVEEAMGASVDPWDDTEVETENGIETVESLVDAVGRWTAGVDQLLVILDQFEDYFLYHREPDHRASTHFDRVFAQLVNTPSLRIGFLISLREDAWAKLDRFKGRIPILFENYLRVDYLALAEAREAIVKPIEHYNETAGEGEPRASIQPELVDRVLHDVRAGRLALARRRAPGSGAPSAEADVEERVETPYLQLVMERLWAHAAKQSPGSDVEARELTLDTLEELNGTEAIVEGHLREALGQLAEADQEVAAAAFEFLVTPSKTKIAHSAEDLAYFTKRPTEDVQRVLTALAGSRRILREAPPPDGGDDITRYELFHDVLAEALLAWCGEQAEAREKRELEQRLRAEEEERRKARRDRIRRRLGLGAAVVAVVAAAVTVVVIVRNQSSNDEAATQTARATDLATRADDELESDPQLALLVARDAVGVKPVAAARKALIRALDASRVRATVGGGPARPCRIPCPTGRGLPTSGLEARVSHVGAFGGRLSFAPNGRVVVGLGRSVRLWDPMSRRDEEATGPTKVTSAATLGGGRVVTADNNEVIRVLRPGAAPRVIVRRFVNAVLSSDGRYVAANTYTDASVYRVSDGRLLAERRLLSSFTSLAFDPRDSGVLAVVGHSVTLWNWREHRSRQLPYARGRFAEPVYTARFTPDGRRLVALTYTGRFLGWDVASGKARFTTHATQTLSAPRMALSPDGSHALVITGKLATIRATVGGQTLATLSGETAGIDDAAFSRDGTRVVTAHLDGTARVWDAATGNPLIELRGHADAVTDAAFTPNGDYVVTIGADGTARLWDVRVGTTLASSSVNVLDTATEPRDAGVAVLRGNDVILWSPRSGKRRLLAHVRGAPTSIAAADTRRGAVVAVGLGSPRSRGRSLAIVDVRTGSIRTFAGGGSWIDDVNFDAAGRRLVTIGGAAPRIWDTTSWSPHRLGSVKLPDPDALDVSAAFTPQGNRVLMLDGDRVALFDAASGAPGPHLSAHFLLDAPAAAATAGFPSLSAAASPDGRTVAVVGPGGAALWDTVTGQITRLKGHAGAVTGVGFSAHGRYVVTAGDDGTVRVWSARLGTSVSVDRRHATGLQQVDFLPSEARILSVGDDGTVGIATCLACLPLGTLEGQAAAATIRPMTAAEHARLLGGAG
jgi:WD40 repeat protein